MINFFHLDDERAMVDLPGYGYAKVPEKMKLKWQATLSKYLETRQSLRGLIAEQPAFYVKILETKIELHANRVTRATTGNVQKAEDGQPSSVRPQSQVVVDPLTLTSHS